MLRAIQKAAEDTAAGRWPGDIADIKGIEHKLPKGSMLAQRVKQVEEAARQDFKERQRKDKKRREEALKSEGAGAGAGAGAAVGLTPEQVEHRQKEQARIEAIVDEEKRKRREAELERDEEITRKGQWLSGWVLF